MSLWTIFRQSSCITEFHLFFKITTPYHGIPGKGSAFRTILEIAEALGVKACAVVDSDLRSITPQWIELLIKPVLEQEYDYHAENIRLFIAWDSLCLIVLYLLNIVLLYLTKK